MRSLTITSEQCFSEMFYIFSFKNPHFHVFFPLDEKHFSLATPLIRCGEMTCWIIQLFAFSQLDLCDIATDVIVIETEGVIFREVISTVLNQYRSVSLKYRFCNKHAILCKFVRRNSKKCQIDICKCIGKTDFCSKKKKELNEKNCNKIFLMVQKALMQV